MTQLMIERLDGRRVRAQHVRHVRTLTGPRGHEDVDVYRLADGTEVECICPDDARAIPVEVSPDADHYPGHPRGA